MLPGPVRTDPVRCRVVPEGAVARGVRRLPRGSVEGGGRTDRLGEHPVHPVADHGQAVPVSRVDEAVDAVGAPSVARRPVEQRLGGGQHPLGRCVPQCRPNVKDESGPLEPVSDGDAVGLEGVNRASPVASAAARWASTACMFALTPLYGDSSVHARSQRSTSSPSSRSRNFLHDTAAASSSSNRAPSTPVEPRQCRRGGCEQHERVGVGLLGVVDLRPRTRRDEPAVVLVVVQPVEQGVETLLGQGRRRAPSVP